MSSIAAIRPVLEHAGPLCLAHRTVLQILLINLKQFKSEHYVNIGGASSLTNQ